jgi:hypothetical protein
LSGAGVECTHTSTQSALRLSLAAGVDGLAAEVRFEPGSETTSLDRICRYPNTRDPAPRMSTIHEDLNTAHFQDFEDFKDFENIYRLE